MELGISLSHGLYIVLHISSYFPNIRSYAFLFLHTSAYFPHISSYFPNISSYFPHLGGTRYFSNSCRPDIFSFPEWAVNGGRWKGLFADFRTTPPQVDLEIFLSLIGQKFSEYDVIGEGGVLINFRIRSRIQGTQKSWNMSM